MAKPNKLSKSHDEALRNFHHVLGGLSLSARAYDEGYFGEAVRLAAAVYTIVHDRGRSTQSLLRQFDRKGIDFTNSADQLHPDNLLPEMNLVVAKVEAFGDGKAAQTYLPYCSFAVPPPKEPGTPQSLPFRRWWEMPIMRDSSRREISRKNLVFHLRNGEGGGHVDPKINEVFADISRYQSVGFPIFYGNTPLVPEYGPHYASMRQIAWEVEQSIQLHCADLLSST